jgi:hypothetical protein
MDAMSSMSDQFVSVEHLVLAMVEDSRFGEALLRGEGLSRDKLKDAIKEIRGSNKVGGQGCAAGPVAAAVAGAGRAWRCVGHGLQCSARLTRVTRQAGTAA